MKPVVSLNQWLVSWLSCNAANRLNTTQQPTWTTTNIILVRFIEQRYFFLPFSTQLLYEFPMPIYECFNIARSISAEANKRLVDCFKALAYCFSSFGLVIIALYSNKKESPIKRFTHFLFTIN